jgi:hypothetical protein
LSAADATTALAYFAKDLAASYRVIEITQYLLHQAVLLATAQGLRAYDAVQLAAALQLHQQRQASGFTPLTLVSADADLNAAAIAAHLHVDDPNQHP